MPRYVNAGAPFERADGSTIETEQEFDPTPAELIQFAHKLQPAEEAGALFEDPDTKASVRWPMAMHPSMYLSIYPKGPHADAATKVLAIEEKRGQAMRPKRAPRPSTTEAVLAASAPIKDKK